MHTVTYPREVFYYETDRMDCVHHSNYIRWFEEARIHFMREMGFPYDQLEASGVLSPVLHAEADYRTMCRFGEQVQIETGIERAIPAPASPFPTPSPIKPPARCAARGRPAIAF